jgi:transposase-like protein
LNKHADLKINNGHQHIMRHGDLPEREIMTGIGPVAVRQPRVRDRKSGGDDCERIRFTPAILPRYARRSKSLEMLIPILYLKGVSTGDFEETLAALLGKEAPGLSASTIARLKEVWVEDYKRWGERDLSNKRYLYVWADGIHLQARLEGTMRNVSSLSSGPRRKAKRSLSASPTARERALMTGAPYCSI